MKELLNYLLSIFLILFVVFGLPIVFVSSILNYEYDINEYCYTYVTFDNIKETYCSTEQVCSSASRFNPELSCKIDNKYFLVKEFELNINKIGTTTIRNQIDNKK